MRYLGSAIDNLNAAIYEHRNRELIAKLVKYKAYRTSDAYREKIRDDADI